MIRMQNSKGKVISPGGGDSKLKTPLPDVKAPVRVVTQTFSHHRSPADIARIAALEAEVKSLKALLDELRMSQVSHNSALQVVTVSQPVTPETRETQSLKSSLKSQSHREIRETAESQPWIAAGVSRATWFRRQKPIVSK